MATRQAKHTLRGVSSLAYGANRLQRGDEITCAIGSQTDLDLSKDRRFVRTLVMGHDSTPDADHAKIVARRTYAKLLGAVVDVKEIVLGLEDDERAAFGDYLMSRRDEFGQELQELLEAAGVTDQDDDGDVDLDDLADGSDPRGGDDDDDPELEEPNDTEGELDKSAELDEQAEAQAAPAKEEPPPPAAPDPMDEAVRFEALGDLKAALDEGKSKGDLMEAAILAGLDVDPKWENAPSSGGLAAADLHAKLSELHAAATA